MLQRDPSSDDNAPIQPVDFTFGRETETQSTPTPTASTANPHPTKNPQRRITAIGGLLAVGLIGVFWLLPQIVQKPQPQLSVTTVTQPQPRQEKTQASPYSDAEIAQQRREVQKVLQDILQSQEELEERDVEVWAGDEFIAAKSLADGADGIYRQRKFKQALTQYRESLSALQALRDSIPERIEQHLAKGNDALDTGDAESAHKAFDLVLTISVDHPRGVRGKERSEKLPQAWKHFSEGQQAFADSDLDTARESLEQSLAVDPETRPAKALLPLVLDAINERDYSAAMSAGYAAIARMDFNAAKTSFQRAAKLKPQAKDPAIGLRQASNGAEQQRIDQLFAGANAQEQEEDWYGAVKSYSTLLKKDTSLVSAITGKARAEARAKLDDQMRELLEDPLNLGSSSRNQYARKVLADARKVNGSDSDTDRLQHQIEELESALTKALIPIPVVLQSDSSTTVTIYHVGQFGNFSEREITLKPGRYTAVGTRAGYRDVRREFTVVPGEEPPTVMIRCAEKINGANNS